MTEQPGADYSVHELEQAISDIERHAQTNEGWEALLTEGGRLIECRRRLYSVMWSLGLVLKDAA